MVTTIASTATLRPLPVMAATPSATRIDNFLVTPVLDGVFAGNRIDAHTQASFEFGDSHTSMMSNPSLNIFSARLLLVIRTTDACVHTGCVGIKGLQSQVVTGTIVANETNTMFIEVNLLGEDWYDPSQLRRVLNENRQSIPIEHDKKWQLAHAVLTLSFE